MKLDVKAKKAQETIARSIIFENGHEKDSKERLTDLWEKLESSTEGCYDLIEESIVNSLKYSDLLRYSNEISEKISDESYDNFMWGVYWLIRLSETYRKDKNNGVIWYYYDCIRDPFVERYKDRLSGECRDALEAKKKAIKPLDLWKIGESIIFEVNLRKKGLLPK